MLVLYHPGRERVALHQHLFFELTYIVEGTVEHTVDGKTAVLQKGDYFLVDCGSTHSYCAPKGETFANLDCLFLPELLDPSLKGTDRLGDVFEHYLVNCNLQMLFHNPSEMVFRDKDGEILTLLNRIQKEGEKKLPGYREMIRCYLVELLHLTIRRSQNASVATGVKSISSYLTSYAAKHYTEDVSLTKLAAEMNYSLPYISKCFKEEMGISFVDYLQHYRVKQAKRLLLSTKQNLAQIGEQVGYRDAKFFSQVFKKITGLTPQQYRKSFRA